MAALVEESSEIEEKQSSTISGKHCRKVEKWNANWPTTWPWIRNSSLVES
jgi:hypothetical protein